MSKWPSPREDDVRSSAGGQHFQGFAVCHCHCSLFGEPGPRELAFSRLTQFRLHPPVSTGPKVRLSPRFIVTESMVSQKTVHDGTALEWSRQGCRSRGEPIA